jgi:hypothetical protein
MFIKLSVGSGGRSPQVRGEELLPVAILTLLVGFGLSIFLFLTHSWFYGFFFTAVTLLFDVCGIFLLSKIGWRRLVARSPSAMSGNPVLFLSLFGVWAALLGLYFSGPYFSQLLQEGQIARVETSDPSCSPGLLRGLAKQPSSLGAATDPASHSVCTVEWTRAVSGFSSRSCLLLDSGRSQTRYCLANIYATSSFDRNGLHYGDMIVAQTAFGKPSAFLYPSRTVARHLVYPRGEIAKTGDDPDNRYFRHVESTFMYLLFYLLFGSLLPIRLLIN